MILKRRATERLDFASLDRCTFWRGGNFCDKWVCASETSLPRCLVRRGNVQRRTRTAGQVCPETCRLADVWWVWGLFQHAVGLAFEVLLQPSHLHVKYFIKMKRAEPSQPKKRNISTPTAQNEDCQDRPIENCSSKPHFPCSWWSCLVLYLHYTGEEYSQTLSFLYSCLRFFRPFKLGLFCDLG